MGFFDSVQSAMNRGQAAAGRSVETVKLNNRIKEIARQRQNLTAQLGASLYEETRNDEIFRAGRESIYDSIANLDAEREQCEAQIAAIEEAARAAEQASRTITCTNCGLTISATDVFCSGCGKPVEEIKAEIAAAQAPAASVATDGPVCPHCGTPVAADDAFCINCGHKIEMPLAESGAAETEAVQAPVDEPAVAANPVCPSCGAPITDEDVFCSGCGQKLK